MNRAAPLLDVGTPTGEPPRIFSGIVTRTRRRLADYRRRTVQQVAVQYATTGWPVVPVAINHDAATIAARHASADPGRVAAWWNCRRWDIGLVTGIAFDVLQLPAHLGSPLHRTLHDSCPTAISPTKTWMFVVTPDNALDPALADAGAILHHGPVLLAPPTRTPAGRYSWIIPPHLATQLTISSSWAQAVLLHTIIRANTLTVREKRYS